MRVKLTKIESNHNNLRTNSIEGECKTFPEVNSGLVILADPLEKGMDVRIVNTSIIKEIRTIGVNDFMLKTLNSLYRLEVLDNG
jgi:transcription-repair coupling factor (superfamily II helicase)